MNNVLSQAEIDALLLAVQQSDAPPKAAKVAPQAEAAQFDLARRNPVTRKRLPGLEQLSRRFAEHFRQSLNTVLGHDVDISLLEIQFTPYANYLHSLYLPTSLNLMRLAPLEGTAMMVFDARLVFRLVEVFFGGSHTAGVPDGRDFSSAERRLVDKLIARAQADLAEAWQPVCELHCQALGSELNPSLATIVGAADPVVVCRFQIDAEGGGGGEFHICCPAAMLEPIRESLSRSELAETRAPDPQWQQAMVDASLNAPVATRYVLAEKTLRLGELAALEVGDVIPLGSADLAEIRVAGLPLLRAVLQLEGDVMRFTVKGRK